MTEINGVAQAPKKPEQVKVADALQINPKLSLLERLNEAFGIRNPNSVTRTQIGVDLDELKKALHAGKITDRELAPLITKSATIVLHAVKSQGTIPTPTHVGEFTHIPGIGLKVVEEWFPPKASDEPHKG